MLKGLIVWYYLREFTLFNNMATGPSDSET